MGGSFRDALLAALGVSAVLLIGYQLLMLRWTKKTVGSIPRAILVLRITNVVLMLGAAALVAWNLAR